MPLPTWKVFVNVYAYPPNQYWIVLASFARGTKIVFTAYCSTGSIILTEPVKAVGVKKTATMMNLPEWHCDIFSLDASDVNEFYCLAVPTPSIAQDV